MGHKVLRSNDVSIFTLFFSHTLAICILTDLNGTTCNKVEIFICPIKIMKFKQMNCSPEKESKMHIFKILSKMLSLLLFALCWLKSWFLLLSEWVKGAIANIAMQLDSGL